MQSDQNAAVSLAPRYFALVPAAGVGARMAATSPKQYLPIAGRPMLSHVLSTLTASSWLTHTFVVVNRDDDYIETMLWESSIPGQSITILRNGGSSRQQSVLNGLLAIRELVTDDDWVLVHDAARPGLDAALIEALVLGLRDDNVGGLLALPIVDTLKRGDANGRAQGTVAREGLWAAQTPQMFRYGLLLRALQQAGDFTDEASAIEMLGLHPRLIIGNPRNFKVTTPSDISLAELYLKQVN